MLASAFKPPRFASHHQGQPFFQILTQRVNQYFKDENRSSKGDVRLYAKTGILLAAFFTTYIVILYVGSSFWLALPFWIVLGLLTWLLLLLTPAGEEFPAQLAGVFASLAGMLIGSLGPQAIANKHSSHHALQGSRL